MGVYNLYTRKVGVVMIDLIICVYYLPIFLTLAVPGGGSIDPPLRFFYSRINLSASINTIFADIS